MKFWFNANRKIVRTYSRSTTVQENKDHLLNPTKPKRLEIEKEIDKIFRDHGLRDTTIYFMGVTLFDCFFQVQKHCILISKHNNCCNGFDANVCYTETAMQCGQVCTPYWNCSKVLEKSISLFSIDFGSPSLFSLLRSYAKKHMVGAPLPPLFQ